MRKLPVIVVTCPGCGSPFETNQSHIDRGRGKHCSKACGARVNSTKHGHTTHSGLSRTYTTWSQMRQRCLNPRATKWPDYGGRGITVSDQWADFAVFLADMGERPDGMTLDRIDNDGNYERGNCRWATPSQQQFNRRNRVSRRATP